MKRFQTPPLGSTVYAELMKGRICERTGHLGRASIVWQAETHEFVVVYANDKRSRFRTYNAAIGFFNRSVGRVKEIHPREVREAIGQTPDREAQRNRYKTTN